MVHSVIKASATLAVARLFSVAVGAAFFVLTSSVYAQAESNVKATATMPNQGAYMMQVLLGLLFVLGLVFALAWLLKRVGQGSLVGGQQMKIVAAMPMGTRERIALVDVGGQHILLGITSTNINTLHVFPEPVDFSSDSDATGSEFSSKLKDILSKGVVKS
jgi:flagellar protein FliO/FliZ